MNNNLLRVFLLCLFIFALTTTSLYSTSQQQDKGYITGRIIDSKKKPVQLVAVSIKGSNLGDNTNEKGEYTILNAAPGDQTLLISGIGIKANSFPIQIVAGINQIPDIEVENAVELNEVVVTGKSEARKKQEQAYAITVLDLKRVYNTTIPLNKLLNNVSSVRIREDGGVGSNYNFTMNGFSGNQVKFFLDGIPMDNFGSSFNLSNISVNMAERVEVYKGVLPVSLGGDALGGAVNIVSRKDANYLDASYSIGSFNTHRASVNGAYTNLKSGFTVRANAFYNYSDNNYKVYAPIVDLNSGSTIGNQWVKRFHDNYESAGIKLETGVTNKSYADYLLAGVILSQNDKDVQTGSTMESVYGGVTASSETAIPTIRYKKDDLFLDGLSLSMYGAYNNVNSFNVDTLSRTYNWLGEWVPSATKGERKHGVEATDSKTQIREWLANANLNYVINEHQSVTLNNVFSSLNRTIFDKMDPDNESNKIPQNLKKDITGLGWQITYNRWNATAFGKLYHLESSTYKWKNRYAPDQKLIELNDKKTNFGYGAAFTYFILPKLQGKLSYEHAYRLPESTEMFGDGLNQKANPDLKPESSNNANVGLAFEQPIKDHTFYLEASYIYRNTKDFILREVAAGNPISGYNNVGKVLTNGFEGGIKYRWKELLHAGVNMTYQHIIDNQQFVEAGESYIDDNFYENTNYKGRLPNIPYLFGHGDAGMSFKNVGLKKSELSIDYSINYVQQYYLSSPGLGAKATKKIIPEQLSQDIAVGYTMQDGRYSVALECSNFANEMLYDNYGLQKPGRAFNLKLRYFFK